MRTAAARESFVERLAAKPDADAVGQLGALDKILNLLERLQQRNAGAQVAGTAQAADQLGLAREVIGLVKELRPTTSEAHAGAGLLGPVKEIGEVVRTFHDLFAPPAAPTAAAAAAAPTAISMSAAEVELEKPAWERILVDLGPVLAPTPTGSSKRSGWWFPRWWNGSWQCSESVEQ